jgi:hypothetical protein
MAQALQSEDEEYRSEQVTEFDEVSLPDHKNWFQVSVLKLQVDDRLET